MIEQPFKQPRLLSSQSHFSRVPRADIQRSVFNRTHQHKTAFDAGYLIPIYVDEVVPGDSYKMRMTSFARLATPVVPIMDNLYADVFFFFVPNRLVWENWERFNGAQDNPDDPTDFLMPTMTSPAVTGYSVGSLHDYMGIRPGIPGIEHRSDWHRSYNLVFNTFFRDQNLQNSVVVDLDDGPDDPADYVLLRRGKRHDYFTSALPWTQKGPAVELPLGTRADISGLGLLDSGTGTASGSGLSNNVRETGDSAVSTYASGWKGISNQESVSGNQAMFAIRQSSTTGYPDIYADLSNATAATINQLREAFQLQRLFERDARGGTRYVEILKAHWGVTSPDFRLQRPEYLGGGTTMINVNPVPQTSSTDGTTPQGNLAAMGVFHHTGVGFNKSFVEHGVIIGLISVRADLTYQQGMNRMWFRSTRYDFYWPALAHLGEQAILNKEIFIQGSANPTADEGVFGYQERFAEYRYKPSLITGILNSDAAGSLDVWHLAQDFSALPTLGDTFIQENPPLDRVIATPTEPHFLFDAVFDLKCARPMPVYSVPGLIDHF